MQKMECCKILHLSLPQVSLLLLMFTTLSSCCFIRNCPPGGKRSMGIVSQPTKECMSCGPGLLGQCVGPDICCGPFGCQMGTSESNICGKENESTTACAISGPPCGSRNQGNCVADGICCDTGACSFNTKCKLNSEPRDVQILSLLKTLGLIETKAYNNAGMSWGQPEDHLSTILPSPTLSIFGKKTLLIRKLCKNRHGPIYGHIASFRCRFSAGRRVTVIIRSN